MADTREVTTEEARAIALVLESSGQQVGPAEIRLLAAQLDAERAEHDKTADECLAAEKLAQEFDDKLAAARTENAILSAENTALRLPEEGDPALIRALAIAIWGKTLGSAELTGDTAENRAYAAIVAHQRARVEG